MRARYYEPTTGRFISEDLSGKSPNGFIYAVNSPSTHKDRTGNLPYDAWLTFIALLYFSHQASKAANSNDVEQAWSFFMGAYNFTISSALVGELGDHLDFASTIALPIALFLTISNRMFGLAGIGVGTVLAYAPYFLKGATQSLRFAMLCYAYQLRLGWYLDDIDNF